MDVNGEHFRTIWRDPASGTVKIIDQRRLPHTFEVIELHTLDQAVEAIAGMAVRGAPLIGATAAYGMALAIRADASDTGVERAGRALVGSRPTAVNLAWAVRELSSRMKSVAPRDREAEAFRIAAMICDEDVESCRAIARHGADLFERLAPTDRPLQVLTHCNAGWLATVDWGTALSPIYEAKARGIDLHVWVDETRPRNQGAALTAWELGQQGIAHTVIVDNAGGHLMRQGRVDACIVGADRVTANGDVCNKIGTYLKALAAVDNDVPFYVAMPASTIDWDMPSGDLVPIEERHGDEVSSISGRLADGTTASVRLTPEGSPSGNFAFDVTPARLVTGLITDRGVCEASVDGLAKLYDRRAAA